jgi:hypothetical protein
MSQYPLFRRLRDVCPFPKLFYASVAGLCMRHIPLDHDVILAYEFKDVWQEGFLCLTGYIEPPFA